MREQDNAAYYDEERGQFYTITWFDTGNNEIPTRHYIEDNSGQIDCQVIKPTFTILEIELLENLIRDNRDEGTYYGNKKYYYKRLETIEKKLNKMREAL